MVIVLVVPRAMAVMTDIHVGHINMVNFWEIEMMVNEGGSS
jgi:hypothetical protein